MGIATDTLTMDTIEQRLREGEAAIARVRAAQMVLLREADRRQAPLSDGYRTMAEWATERLDVAPETAKALVSTARRLEALPTVEATAMAGTVSFDRIAATARAAEPENDATILDELSIYDVAGIRRLVASRHRISRDDERRAFDRRYLVTQPNLDESSWRLYGRLPGAAGRVVVEALDRRADEFAGDPYEPRSTRRADALWAISLDSLAGGDGATVESATPLLTVFVDATEAAPANGEAGVTLASGPRIGPSAIEAILCEGVVEVTARTGDGRALGMGRRSRIIPPRLRRFILARDGGVCTVAGCTSRYRLQPHHIVPWSEGGTTDEENLTTLCWFHHHVVIHGRGFTIDPDSPTQRRRLRRPAIHAPTP